MKGLVEEIQVYGNRMEAALSDGRAFASLREEYDELEKKVNQLKKKGGVLKKKKERYDWEDQ